MEKVKVTQGQQTSRIEIWRDIKGYEGLYQISNKGKVKCLPKNVVCTPKGHVRHYPERIATQYTRGGYKYVELSKGGEAKKYSVHRLVAIAFVPSSKSKTQVNHIDGIKDNNKSDNLEWVTPQENIKHAYENRLRPKFHKGRRVIQMDLNGNKIKEFKSINKASKLTGTDYSSIVRACKGRYEQAGGFKWTLAEDRKDV